MDLDDSMVKRVLAILVVDVNSSKGVRTCLGGGVSGSDDTKNEDVTDAKDGKSDVKYVKTGKYVKDDNW